MTGKLLTVQEAADLLRLHPRTVMNMARRGDLPGSKIGKQWRFDSSSLENWLSLRMGNAEPTAEVSKSGNGVPERVIDLLNPMMIRVVQRLDSRMEVLEELAVLLERNEELPDYRTMIELLDEREEMVSTALGQGIAFPHPRHPLTSLSTPTVAVLVIKEGIEFGAPDDAPTHAFICLCSNSDVAHVRILAKLVHLFRSGAGVDLLRRCNSAEDVMEVLQRLEIEDRSGNGRYQ